MVILGSAAVAGLSAAPWVPMRKADVIRAVELAEVKAGDRVYDLGCGDGRLVFAASGRGAKAIGLEISLLPFVIAKIRSWFQPLTRVSFKSFFRQNLEDADVVFVFLMKKIYPKLATKLTKELKPGARIVVYCWPIDELKSSLIEKNKPTEKDLPLYLYQI